MFFARTQAAAQLALRNDSWEDGIDTNIGSGSGD